LQHPIKQKSRNWDVKLVFAQKTQCVPIAEPSRQLGAPKAQKKNACKVEFYQSNRWISFFHCKRLPKQWGQPCIVLFLGW